MRVFERGGNILPQQHSASVDTRREEDLVKGQSSKGELLYDDPFPELSKEIAVITYDLLRRARQNSQPLLYEDWSTGKDGFYENLDDLSPSLAFRHTAADGVTHYARVQPFGRPRGTFEQPVDTSNLLAVPHFALASGRPIGDVHVMVRRFGKRVLGAESGAIDCNPPESEYNDVFFIPRASDVIKPAPDAEERVFKDRDTIIMAASGTLRGLSQALPEAICGSMPPTLTVTDTPDDLPKSILPLLTPES